MKCLHLVLESGDHERDDGGAAVTVKGWLPNPGSQHLWNTSGEKLKLGQECWTLESRRGKNNPGRREGGKGARFRGGGGGRQNGRTSVLILQSLLEAI